MDLLQVGFGLRSKARGKLMWKKSAKQLVELTEGDSDRHFYQHFPSLIWKYGDRTLEKKKGGGGHSLKRPKTVKIKKQSNGNWLLHTLGHDFTQKPM